MNNEQRRKNNGQQGMSDADRAGMGELEDGVPLICEVSPNFEETENGAVDEQSPPSSSGSFGKRFISAGGVFLWIGNITPTR